MGNYNYIFFDLDGTLTDSAPGIMNSFTYAIEHMGGKVSDKAQLKKFVGPPLQVTFEESLGYSPEDAAKGIAFYREYYHGMGGRFENEVYPGIEELLAKLKSEGKKLIVATSKNEYGTKVVLEHFGLDKYFDFVAAANDEDRQHKVDVLKYAIKEVGVQDLSEAVMVGDRENDISAAAAVGMDSIGVLFGYGDEKELTTAGATYLAKSAKDIGMIISQGESLLPSWLFQRL